MELESFNISNIENFTIDIQPINIIEPTLIFPTFEVIVGIAIFCTLDKFLNPRLPEKYKLPTITIINFLAFAVIMIKIMYLIGFYSY